MVDPLGKQFGNYRLLRLLGQGGFADVYLGEHVENKTLAAIKLLQMRLINHGLQDFLTEVGAISRLTHPHIVHMLDFGIEDDTPFLVIEYAPDGTLRERYPQGTRLPLATLLPYVKQAAGALHYAHENKLIHRDVKPENMLLNARGEILLSDFGIALVTHSSRSNSTRDIAGTIAYMAPEQLQGKPCAASDQYSLGIVVYELLCGDRPFQGSFVELYAQQMFAVPASLKAKVPTLSPQVEQVIMRALAKDPLQRFVSVQGFADALAEASESVAPILRAKRQVPRRAMLLGSAGLIVAGVGIAWLAIAPNSPVRSSTSVGSTANATVGAPTSGGNTAVLPTDGQVTPTATPGPVGSTPSATAPASSPTTPADTPPSPTSSNPTVYVYRGQRAGIYSAPWSPDGSRIASGSNDNTVQVWNAMDGSNVVTYTGHSRGVNAVAWSPDGSRIVSGSWDGTAQVWNAADGSHLLTYTGHNDAIFGLAWSPDGSRIVSGSYDSTAQVWDANNGSHYFTYTAHNTPVASVAWSPDGSRIVSGGYDNTARIWSASNGATVLTYTDHSGIVWSVRWSPDGSLIASGSADTTVQVWNANTKSHLLTYTGHTNTVRSVSWSSDGSSLVSGGYDYTAQVWNASDANHLQTYSGHTARVWTVAWSPHSNLIVSGSDDQTACVWQAL